MCQKRLLTILLMAICITGCAGFGPDQTAELDQEELDRQEGLKNLAAIAELQASLPKQRPPSTPPISTPDNSHEGESLAPSAPRISQTEVAPSWLSLFAPSKRDALQSQRLFSATPPIIPSQSYTPSPYPLNPSLVPPYTVFTPTGSAYPGPIRCVPDYLGGSRCR